MGLSCPCPHKTITQRCPSIPDGGLPKAAGSLYSASGDARALSPGREREGGVDPEGSMRVVVPV